MSRALLYPPCSELPFSSHSWIQPNPVTRREKKSQHIFSCQFDVAFPATDVAVYTAGAKPTLPFTVKFTSVTLLSHLPFRLGTTGILTVPIPEPNLLPLEEMVVMTLTCAIFGERDSAFDVEIDDGAKVSALKKAIQAKNPVTVTCDAKNLQIFLAKKKKKEKKKRKWLKGDELAVVTLDEAGEVHAPGMLDDGNRQNFVRMDPTLYVKNDKCFGTGFTPGEGQVHVLVVVPTEKETSSPYAQLAAKLIQHTFLNVLSTTPSRSQELKNQLVMEYDCERGSNQNGESMLLCMAMNISLPSSVVIASHIFRHDHDDIKSLVQVDDIDDVRNGLLLFKPIKSAFGNLDISFLVDKRDQFTLKIFNPTIKAKLLVDRLTQQQWDALGGGSLPSDWRESPSPIFAPNAPQFNVLTTFGELDGKTLQFPSGSTLRPFRRCLYHQALLARAKAITEKWVSAAYTLDDFSSEGFALDEKMKLLFSSTPYM